jgi:hypothetical protein
MGESAGAAGPVDAVRAAATRGDDSHSVAEGSFWTTWSAATVPHGTESSKPPAAAEAGALLFEAGALLSEADVVSCVLFARVPRVDVATDDDGCAAVEVDCWPPRDVLPRVRGPSVLTAKPDGADVADCVDLDVTLDADPDEVATVPADAPPGVCVDPATLAESAVPEAVDADDVDDDPSDAGSADATPCPTKTAAPTPRATASPPTRPICLAAPIASSWATST